MTRIRGRSVSTIVRSDNIPPSTAPPVSYPLVRQDLWLRGAKCRRGAMVSPSGILPKGNTLVVLNHRVRN